MSSVLAKAWRFVRYAWRSLLRPPTLRDTDDDAPCQGAWVHEGDKGTERRPQNAPVERDGVGDGGLSNQVEVDGSRQPTERVEVAVADPGGLSPPREAEEVTEGPDEQASVKSEVSDGVKPEPEEQGRSQHPL